MGTKYDKYSRNPQPAGLKPTTLCGYDQSSIHQKSRGIMKKCKSVTFCFSASIMMLASQAWANQIASVTTTKTTTYVLEDLKKTDKLNPAINFSGVQVYAGDTINFTSSDVLSNPRVSALKPGGFNQVDFSFTDNSGLSGVLQSNERISVSSAFTKDDLERFAYDPRNVGKNPASLTRSAGLSAHSVEFTLAPYTAVTFYQRAEYAFSLDREYLKNFSAEHGKVVFRIEADARATDFIFDKGFASEAEVYGGRAPRPSIQNVAIDYFPVRFENSSGFSFNYSLTASHGNGITMFATVVPEPSTYALMLLGIGFIGVVASRRHRSNTNL